MSTIDLKITEPVDLVSVNKMKEQVLDNLSLTKHINLDLEDCNQVNTNLLQFILSLKKVDGLEVNIINMRDELKSSLQSFGIGEA